MNELVDISRVTRIPFPKLNRNLFPSLSLILSLAMICLPETLLAEEPVPFRTGILPILTKAGCNAGACHGAAIGQGGFRLSLLGYDPEMDHSHITRELGARRIDVAQPAESLFLKKASGGLDHDGGRRLRRDSAEYRTVRDWIQAGAPYGPKDLHVARLDAEPSDVLVSGPDESLALRIMATLSDGTRQDVTLHALYTSNDDAIVEVSKTGGLLTVGRGLTSIMVRYGGQVSAVRVGVPFGESDEMEWDAREFTLNNRIDEFIRDELVRMRMPASELSDDLEFLRRIYLDVTGRLPKPELVREIAYDSGRSNRAEGADREWRTRVIDELLEGSDFTDYWTMKLADLVLLNGRGGNAEVYHGWLRSQVDGRVPIDQIVRELLTASGETSRVGPANFHLLANDPRDLSEHVGRMFLGMQMGCARCHAHPTDRWTQDDSHAFAAYFAQLSREGGSVRVAGRGEVDHPKSGKPVAPKAPGGLGGEIDSDGDRREALAEWMTDSENPYFARTFVNRVWAHFMGRGLVEPVDDLRPTNPATHPELLDAIAADFIESGFDLRHLVRVIVSSRTYQLTSRSRGINSDDVQLYAKARIKTLPAPVFADAVAQVIGVPDVYDGYPEGTRAVQLISPSTPSIALDVLGRCLRRSSCDAPGGGGGGLAQALHLIHGSTINGKLAGGVGIGGEVGEGEGVAVGDALVNMPDRDVVEDLYLKTFCRLPDADERQAWEGLLSSSERRKEAVQDLLWALLNSREFAVIR